MALVASVAYFSLFRSQKSGSGGGRGDGERDADGGGGRSVGWR